MVIIIDESVNDVADTIISRVSVIYEHMLKWKYWVSAQCSSWTNSIFYNISDIIELDPNTNEKRRANENLHKAYVNAINKVSEKVKNIKKLDKNELEKEFDSIDLLLDKEYIRSWLLNYSKDEDSNKYIENGYTNDYHNKKNKRKKFI